jgi:putative copper export protein/mono/diheme cytochrome c family protein
LQPASGMMDPAGCALRLLHLASLFLLLGVVAVRALAHRDGTSRADSAALSALLALALVSGVGLLAVQMASLPAVGAGSTTDTIRSLLLDSRFGTVWLLRMGLLVAAVVVLWLGRTWAPHLSAALVAASLFALPWSGHSAALGDEPWMPFVHGVHIVAAALWLGSLGPLWRGFRAGSSARPGLALARFSRLAPWLVLLAIGTGAWLGIAHASRWPALFGTPYGVTLLAKLAALGLAMLAAARLRWRWLPVLDSGGARATPAIRAWLGFEIAAAVALLGAASILGQTIPAQHDAILWRLPFRLSVDATWDTAGVPARVIGGAAVAGLAIAAALRELATRRRASHLGSAVTALVAGLAVSGQALAVPAYLDTYRTPSVPYETISVARGQRLFGEHCVRCHGPSAHGDGPDARGLAVAPADLTEPHTALHTAGDIFWWLTHGKPPGVMPGFADRLAEDDRWDIINFVRTLSSGYQARILSERVVPRRPWMPAVEFSYGTHDGQGGALSDARGRNAVLLVLHSSPASDARLVALAGLRSSLREAGTEVLAIPVDGIVSDTGLPTVTEGAEDIVKTYALLRRTLDDPDARDGAPIPAHMELLVDRFGYVRARWLPSLTDKWQNPDALLREARALAAEPQVREPPDDHVH